MKFITLDDVLTSEKEFLIVDFEYTDFVHLKIDGKNKLMVRNKAIDNFLDDIHKKYGNDDTRNDYIVFSANCLRLKSALCLYDGIDYYICLMDNSQLRKFCTDLWKPKNHHKLTNGKNEPLDGWVFEKYKFIDYKFVNGKLKYHKKGLLKEQSILQEYIKSKTFNEFDTMQLLSQWNNPFETNCDKTLDMFAV